LDVCYQVMMLQFKTTNLIINLDHDEWILGDDDGILADLGFGMSLLSSYLQTRTIVSENETEVSFFNRAAYETFRRNPEVILFFRPGLFTNTTSDRQDGNRDIRFNAKMA
jgi:hypothetical protein